MGSIFNNCEYFLKIAETGNITKAAQDLFITQPSLTQYLKKLEGDIGAKLVDRSDSPLTLTPAGLEYLKAAHEYRRLLESFEQKIQPYRERVQGRIKLGIPLTIQKLFVRDLVMPFSAEHPSIKISLNGDNSPVLEKMTSNGSITASIIHILNEKYDNLVYRDIALDKVLIVCNREHALIKGRISSPEKPIQVRLEDLSEEMFYLMEPSYILRKAPEMVFAQTGIYPYRVMEMSDINTVLEMCADSAEGIAFVPESFCYMFDKADKLAFLDLETSPITFRLVYCIRKDDLSPLTAALTDYVEDRIRSKGFRSLRAASM